MFCTNPSLRLSLTSSSYRASSIISRLDRSRYLLRETPRDKYRDAFKELRIIVRRGCLGE